MIRSGSPRFLVVRRDNIGDLICTTPLIAALRARYPASYLAVLANSYNQDVLIGNPDVDEVFAYTKFKHRRPGESLFKALADRIGLLRAIRRAAIDVAILATPRYQARLIRLVRLAGARRVAGFVSSPRDKGIDLAVRLGEDRGMHEVEDVFRLATLFDVTGTPPAMRIFPDVEVAAAMARKLSLSGIPVRGPRIAIHVSARKPSQRWPAERFVELIRGLDSQYQGHAVVLWAPGSAANTRHPGDDEKAAGMMTMLEGMKVSAVPTASLRDLVAILSLCDILICADGGAMHMGAALGKPVVCLFGDSNPTRWHPWETPHEVLHPPSRNVRDISVQEVIDAVDRILNRS